MKVNGNQISGAVAGSDYSAIQAANVSKRLYRRICGNAEKWIVAPLDGVCRGLNITHRELDHKRKEPNMPHFVTSTCPNRALFVTHADYPAPEPTADTSRIQEPDFRGQLTDMQFEKKEESK